MLEVFSAIKEVSAKMVSDLPKLGNFKDSVSKRAQEIPSYRQIKEIVQIRLESPFSWKINANIRSLDELRVYKEAGLKESIINDKPCLKLQSEIDIRMKDEKNDTNLDRMKAGKPPLGKDGKPIELHHIGQRQDGPLAEMTKTEHDRNFRYLHTREESQIDRNRFGTERKHYWKERAKDFE